MAAIRFMRSVPIKSLSIMWIAICCKLQVPARAQPAIVRESIQTSRAQAADHLAHRLQFDFDPRLGLHGKELRQIDRHISQFTLVPRLLPGDALFWWLQPPRIQP